MHKLLRNVYQNNVFCATIRKNNLTFGSDGNKKERRAAGALFYL